MKKLFKFGTELIKGSTKAVVKGAVQGIDEGINGDDIAEVRQEKRLVREQNRTTRKLEEANEERRSEIIGNVWIIAFFSIFCMCAKTIYENGFNNQAVANIANDYSIALFFPILIALSVSLFRKYF